MNIKAFIQRNVRILIYAAFGVCTFVCFLALMLWAGATGQDGVIVLQAKAVTSPTTRSEYIVGETIDITGVTMQLPDGTVLTEENLQATADLEKAGMQAVTLTYVGSDATYQATYPVQVFSVRHMDVRQKEVRKNLDGSWNLSDLIIWAELSGAPTEFEKPEQFSALKDTAIVLKEQFYTFTAVEGNTEGFYYGTVTCGNCSATFGFNPDPDAPVQNEERILTFTNTNGGNEKLTLYVTENSIDFATPNGSQTVDVRGVYIYENANGEKTRYQFIFALAGWTSTFQSETAGEGLYDRQDAQDASGNTLAVTVNGITFTANKWQKAVLNMNV